MSLPVSQLVLSSHSGDSQRSAHLDVPESSCRALVHMWSESCTVPHSSPSEQLHDVPLLPAEDITVRTLIAHVHRYVHGPVRS